jgi:hypothetical protein
MYAKYMYVYTYEYIYIYIYILFQIDTAGMLFVQSVELRNFLLDIVVWICMLNISMYIHIYTHTYYGFIIPLASSRYVCVNYVYLCVSVYMCVYVCVCIQACIIS